MHDIVFETRDGHSLPATLFESRPELKAGRPVVLISSATAVSRRFYRHFAQYLADDAALAVMTYDYRGMNGKLPRKASHAMRMSDWAILDMPAAVAELQRRYPDSPVVGVGHSFGGQAIGLSGAADRFLRYMTVAAGSGWLGHTREHRKLSRNMNWVGLPAAALFGQTPRFLGLGEPLPFGVYRQWRKWCQSPEYFMADDSIPERARLEKVTIPMLAVGFEDDPWATRQSVEAMVAWYRNADIRIRWFEDRELPSEIGHFGFFRAAFRETLWPQLADWLIRD